MLQAETRLKQTILHEVHGYSEPDQLQAYTLFCHCVKVAVGKSHASGSQKNPTTLQHEQKLRTRSVAKLQRCSVDLEPRGKCGVRSPSVALKNAIRLR